MPPPANVELLFSYGTLQLESVQLATFGRKPADQPDRLLGYRLDQVEIRDPAVVKASGLARHLMLAWTGEATDTVQGTVLQLSAQELAQADAYEVATTGVPARRWRRAPRRGCTSMRAGRPEVTPAASADR